MPKLMNISVIGAGSWGTALARLLANKGHSVKIWAYEAEVADEINKNHKNSIYLEDAELPKSLYATNDLAEALNDTVLVVSVVPSHTLRYVLNNAKKFIPADAIIVSCTKGIEVETGKLVSEIFAELIPEKDPEEITYLSGPSFAREVAKDLPTSVVIAGLNPQITKTAQDAFHTNSFLPFTHNDIIGVEVGGAVKNIIAIATGISDGLGLGLNCRAATITRGLYEMIKIGKALGANPLTFSGLSGMGDLILTATSKDSRNFSLGYRIGQGQNYKDILANMTMVAEGVKTTEAIHKIICRLRINAPICSEMYHILYEEKPVEQSVIDLTRMKLKEELRKIL